MCRWIAYSGEPIFLEELIAKPENSLLTQSLHAREAKVETNGDGFGFGWYAHRDEPGHYREVLPAWNDENLRWNVHACAVPPQFDVVEAFLDWQFAQISGDDDRSGDHKPSGYLFLDEDTVILWENTNFRNQAADNPTVEELWNLILESLSAE